MDTRVEAVLREYEARSARESVEWDGLPPEAVEERIDDFLLCIGPATGQLLNLLVRESGAMSVLELGAGYGYSTVWLAEAARANGGRVVAMERSVAKTACAVDALDRAGLGDDVELRTGDALQLLDGDTETYDFVLLDLWKDLYVACFDACLPKLERGAMLVADNMLEPASVRLHAIRFRKHVNSIADVQSVLLPVGSGLLLCRCRV